jgi:hypothetical protein
MLVSFNINDFVVSLNVRPLSVFKLAVVPVAAVVIATKWEPVPETV